MSTFGKVLVVLNVLFALVFVYVAANDWGVQRGWAYSEFRHELAVNGLPLDNLDQITRVPDRPTVKELSGPLLNDLFAPAGGGALLGGGPVQTLVEEVQRVQTKIQGNLSSLSGDALRHQLLNHLLPGAKTTGERTRLAAMQPQELIAELNHRFTTVINPTEKNDEEKATRRQAIAHLLYHLDADPSWRQRVMVIVGLSDYVGAISQQAEQYAKMANEARADLLADQATFEKRYLDMINQLTLRAQELIRVDNALKTVQEQVREHDTLVKARTEESLKLEMMLADARETTKRELANQQRVERELFQIQQMLGKAFDNNKRLEQELRRKELGRDAGR